MHYLSYVLLFLSLSSPAFAQTPADGVRNEPTPGPEQVNTLPQPSPTLHEDDLAEPQNGAIVPTAPGEIGVNPVDLPPASHAPIGVDTQYLTEEAETTKWIGDDEWFSGSATVGGGPDATSRPIPKGFQVSVGDDGSVEIALSQWVRDKFEAIAEGLPACSAKRRRQDVSSCTRRRTYQFAEEIARDSDLMEQVEGLSSELAQAIGGDGYAAEIVSDGQTLTFGGADLVGEALQSLGAIPELSEASPLAVGVFGSIVLSAVSFNGVLSPGDKADPMAWKFGVAKPEAIPVPELDDDDEDECPENPKRHLPCASTECVGTEDTNDPKCSIGKYKDCPCFWPGEIFIQPFFEEWAEIEEMLGTVSTQLSVECDPQGDSTGLPESLFRGGIYDKFCEELEDDMGRALTFVVDHEGNEIQPKAKRDGSAHRPRSPPVKPDDYEGYVIELKWEPTENGGACPETCKESLLRVSNSQCGHSGPHQNTMAGESKYDALCGKYTISVAAPENPPPPVYRTSEAPPRATPTHECWPDDLLGDHGPVDGDRLSRAAQNFCDKDITMKWGNVSWTEWAADDRYGEEPTGTWLTLAATWDKEACDRDHEPVSVAHPEGLDHCDNLLFQNWRQCDNGGAGGHILVGCVRYIFWPWEAFKDRDAQTPHDLIRDPTGLD